MYGTPPGIPGLVQTNITNSAGEKWALLTKTLRWKIAKLRMRTEMEEQFYFTLLQCDVIIQISTTDARSPICAERSTFLIIIIMNKSQELKVFHGRQKLTSAKN